MERIDWTRLVSRTGGSDGAAGGAVDPLTGLPDRRQLERAIRQAVAESDSERPLALLRVDLDQFTRINERYGRETGDEVLAWLGGELRGLAGERGFVARTSGNGFALLLPNAGRGDALRAAAHLREHLAGAPGLGRRALRASIGVALHPADARDGLALDAAAEEALESAKQRGRDRIVDAARIDADALVARDALARLGRPRLVGRSRTLSRVATALCALEQGEGRLLFVRGAEGAGKTALLGFLAGQLPPGGGPRAISVTAHALESQQPYALTARILRALVARALLATDLLPDEIPKDEASALRFLLGQPQAPEPGGDAAARSDFLRHCESLFARLLTGQPTLLLVDDADHADHASLVLLAVLLGRTDCPLLACIAMGLETQTAGLDALARSAPADPEELELGPLAPDAVEHLLCDAFAGLDAARLARELAQASHGSPRTVLAFARQMLRAGQLVARGGRFFVHLPAGGGDQLPSSFAQCVRESVAELSNRQCELLAQLALLAEPTRPARFAELTRQSRADLLGFLERADRLGLTERDVAGAARLAGQTVAAEIESKLEPERLAALHERVALHLEATARRDGLLPPAARLVFHLEGAGRHERASRFRLRLEVASERLFCARECESVAPTRHVLSVGQPTPAGTRPAEAGSGTRGIASVESGSDTRGIPAAEAEHDEAISLEPGAARLPDVTRALIDALRKRELYPEGSSARNEAVSVLDAVLASWLEKDDQIELSLEGDDLLANGSRLRGRDAVVVAAGLVDAMAEAGCRALRVRRGFEPDALRGLIECLSGVPLAAGVDLPGIELEWEPSAAPSAATEPAPAAPIAPAPATQPEPEPPIASVPGMPADPFAIVPPEPDVVRRAHASAPEVAALAGLAPAATAAQRHEAERVLAGFASHPEAVRAALLDRLVGMRRDLEPGQLHEFSERIAPWLLDELTREARSSVLERIADLLCRMGDDLIELGEPRLAAGIFEAQSVRRRQLAGDAASALERFPNASSKRLLFDALRGGGRSGEHALGVLASLDALALPWLVEGICAVDELRPRHALARLVARCGGADRLRSELGRQTRPSARANLLSVMEVAGVRKVASEVTLGLADDDPEVRAAALALATRVRDSAVLELVLDEAGHPDRERSLAAIAELGDVHAHAATARLVGLLRAGDADRVTACARALGRSGAPGAAEPLAAELSRRNWRGRPLWPTSTRAALVEALAAIDTDAGRAALAAATDDADALVAHLAQAKLAADG